MNTEVVQFHPKGVPSSRAKVLAVTSGKGGVGKTHIAANLAICMAASGHKIILVDGDASLGNLDILLNIRSKYHIGHVVNGSKPIGEVLQSGPFGLEVLCGASGVERLAELQEVQSRRLVQQLDTLQQGADLILLDTAAGISKSVIGFCQVADHVLVVTTPDPSAMTDAYGLVKVLVRNEYPGRVSLLVNMAEHETQGRKIYQQIAAVARRFLSAPLDYAGTMLHDPLVTAAVRARSPVVLAYPKSRIAVSIKSLARRLSHGATIRTEAQPFLRKVANWFS